MARLTTTPNLRHPDDVYEMLIDLHRGLDDKRSALVNAKLIMLLVNHIGDEEVLSAAFRIAGGERKAPEVPRERMES